MQHDREVGPRRHLHGGRFQDLAGLALFGAASLLATFAWDPASFLAGRALQGLGAAAIVPTGMSLLTTTFPEGPARDCTLGISGTLLSLGFTVGMVAGGVLTDAFGWRSTMGLLTLFALIVLPLAPTLLPESRHTERPRLDVPGAVTVTGGLLALIYALSTAAERGFGSADVIAALVTGVALLTLFGYVESRTVLATTSPTSSPASTQWWHWTRRSCWGRRCWSRSDSADGPQGRSSRSRSAFGRPATTRSYESSMSSLTSWSGRSPSAVTVFQWRLFMW